MNKYGMYSKDFNNISENFARLNEGQNKLMLGLNTHETEIQRVRNDMSGSFEGARKIEDFLNNNGKLNNLVDEANKLWTFF